MLKITGLYKTFNPGTVNAKTALNGLNPELKDGDFVTSSAATAQASPLFSTPSPTATGSS